MIKVVRLFVAAVCLAALTQAAQAQQAMSQTVSLHIDAPKLARALIQLTEQSGMQLIYPAGKLTVDRPARSLTGRYTLPAALDELLQGTGLTYKFLDARTIAILDPSAKSAHTTNSEETAEPLPAPAANKNSQLNNTSWLVASAEGAATQAENSSSASAASAPAEDTTEIQQVTVTGSRVITNGNDSPTPVTVITTEQMTQLQPSTMSDMLNDMPQFQGSQNSTSGAGAGIRNGAAAYLTLRNAGDNHTLVLYDGHRVQPTTSQESHASDVDINMIPQLLLERVDVVTGGASAVYGSDAVTGVVNFITDTKFTGVKFNASYGVSTYGDDQTYDVAIAGGQNLFDGRGHIEGSFEYHDDPGIHAQKLNRPFFAADYGGGGLGTAASPYYSIQNARLSSTTFGGLINSGALKGLQFSQNGLLSPFVNGAPTGTANEQSGGDGAWFNVSSIKASLVSSQLFGRFDYDFTDTTHGYVQLAATRAHDISFFQPFTANLTLGYNNPFLGSVQPAYQAQVASALAANSLSSFSFSKMMLNNVAPSDDYTDFDMLLAGLNGSIGSYKWSVGLEHSTSSVDARNDGNINVGNLLASANAVVNPADPSQIVCHAALTNQNYASCVPLNLFGPTSESRAALNYITAVTKQNAYTTLNDYTASITGAPVSVWAGPVNMAVSGEWHRLDYHLNSDNQPSDLVDCNGIQFGCTQGTTLLWAQNTLYTRSPVHQTVGELAYEADVPLLKNIPFVEALSFNGAARYTDYNASGSVWTWKLGLDWHVNDELTLRATRSHDIRAPNLNDLYNPPQPNINNFSDIHTNTVAHGVLLTLSNPNLVPESAATTTVGFVYRPHFIPNFSLSMDAYRIKINDAIVPVTGTTVQVQQACEASGGSSPLCNLMVRPLPFSNTTSANFPTEFLGEPENIASLYTYGADFEASYATRVLDRPLNLRSLLSYQPHLIYDNGVGGVVDVGDAASGVNQQAASPSLKLTIMGQYQATENLNVSVMERWRNSMKRSGISGLVFTDPTVASIAYTTLNVSYDVKTGVGHTELFLNVQNLFNRAPVANYVGASPTPGLFLISTPGLAIGDDVVGRYFTVGFRFRG